MPPRRRVIHPFARLEQHAGDFNGEIWTLTLTSRTGAVKYISIMELTPVTTNLVSWRVYGHVSGPWRQYETVIRIVPGANPTRRTLLPKIGKALASAYRYGALD